MSVVPVSDSASRRTIGDILLAHGFVSKEALAEAAAEQERTAQPLGQILVAHGVITRLELASALAEQWSDPSASITVLPHSTPAVTSPSQPHDDAQYAARLQDAVADLARRVQANQPLEGIDERVGDLSQRIEATLARTQRIEATVATLAESLEGVTGGVEEAFGALQSGTAELAHELRRIDQALTELASRPTEPQTLDPAVAERLEELRAAVDALAGRPVVEPELATRLDRVEALASESAARTEVESQAAMLADLRATVSELDGRPDGNPELDTRLARIEETLASVADAAAVEALAARVEEAAGDTALRAAVASRLDAVESRLEAESADPRLEALSLAVETIREDLAAIPAASDQGAQTTERIELLTGRVEELVADRAATHALVARLDAIEARLAADLVTPDELAQALDRARQELSPGTHEPDGRVDALVEDLDALRAELGTIVLPPAPDPLAAPLAERVEELTARMERFAAERGDTDSLVAKLEALEARLASGLVTPEELGHALERTHSDLASSASASSDRVDELGRRVEELAADADGRDAVAARLAAIETRLDSNVDTMDVLARAFDRIRDDLTHLPRSPSSDAPAGESAEAASAAVTDALRDELGARIDDLARTLEGRLAAIEAPRSGEEAPREGFEAELEHVRAAVLQVGLHLGEHDRTLAELMRSRGVPQRLDELVARIDELAAAGTTSGPPHPRAADVSGDVRALMQRFEDAETASQADRERMMSRLERMASSIDWRLQRLETDETGE